MTIESTLSLGYGERLSSPCGLLTIALYSDKSRELMGAYRLSLLSRSISWFLLFTRSGELCKNGAHATHERHSCTNQQNFCLNFPPLGNTGGKDKGYSRETASLPSVKPLPVFNSGAKRLASILFIYALTQHLQTQFFMGFHS